MLTRLKHYNRVFHTQLSKSFKIINPKNQSPSHIKYFPLFHFSNKTCSPQDIVLSNNRKMNSVQQDIYRYKEKMLWAFAPAAFQFAAQQHLSNFSEIIIGLPLICHLPHSVLSNKLIFCWSTLTGDDMHRAVIVTSNFLHSGSTGCY